MTVASGVELLYLEEGEKIDIVWKWKQLEIYYTVLIVRENYLRFDAGKLKTFVDSIMEVIKQATHAITTQDTHVFKNTA